MSILILSKLLTNNKNKPTLFIMKLKVCLPNVLQIYFHGKQKVYITCTMTYLVG